MQSKTHTSTKRLAAIAALALLPNIAAATCTAWNHTRSVTENYSSNPDIKIDVENKSCAASEKKPCKFSAPQTYNITAERTIMQALKPPSPLSLSKDEEDAIFKLASEAYYADLNLTQRDLWTTVQGQANTTVLSEQLPSFLDIRPGYDATLYFTPIRRMAFGKLGNCTNKTLEGMEVRAAVPRLDEGAAEVSYRPVIMGNWGVGSGRSPSVISDDGRSGDNKPINGKPSSAQRQVGVSSLMGACLALGLALSVAVM